jgi:AraC-like DNA-binding protein
MISWQLKIRPHIREIWRGAWPAATLEPDRYLYDHELVVVSQGSCRIDVEDHSCAVSKGEALIIPPGSRHRTLAGLSGVTRFCVHFHWTPQTRLKPQPIWCFFPKRPRQGSVTSAPSFVPSGLCGRVLDIDLRALTLADCIHENWLAGDALNLALCHAQFLEMLLRITGGSAGVPNEPRARSRLAHEVKDLLDRDLATPVQTLLPILGFSYAHLCRIFCAKFGITPVEYRNAVRLENVRDLLRNTHLNIAEIAERTGFPDPAYMTRIFRRRYGKPPSLFR